MLNKGRVLDSSDASVEARYRLNDIFATAWLSHVISALAKLGVPDIVSDVPMSCEDIAAKTNVHAQSLYRAMRACAANGIFVEHDGRKFSHNEISVLLTSSHPYSWKGMACMWNHPSCIQGWTKFADSMRDGRSGIQHAFGKSLYEHLEETPGGTLAFSDAMISNSAHPAQSIAKKFPFQNYELIMDLGGGVGTLLCAILQEHKNVRGTIFEIEELKNVAEESIARHNLSARANVTVGNFLGSIPAGPDLFMVKNSLWNWTDEQCNKIIGNVRDAAREKKAKFLIIEYVIDSTNAAWTTLYDLQILNMPGGRARTMSEYEALLLNNGFAIDQIDVVEDETLILCSLKD